MEEDEQTSPKEEDEEGAQNCLNFFPQTANYFPP